MSAIVETVRMVAARLQDLVAAEHERLASITPDLLALRKDFLAMNVHIIELCTAFIAVPAARQIVLDGLRGVVELDGDLTPEVARAIADEASKRISEISACDADVEALECAAFKLHA